MIFAAAFAVIGLTSCKKDWTCECTYSDPTGDIVTTLEINDAKKKDAEAACDALGLLGASCELK